MSEEAATKLAKTIAKNFINNKNFEPKNEAFKTKRISEILSSAKKSASSVKSRNLA